MKNKKPVWHWKVLFNPTQRDKLTHMFVSMGVASVFRWFGFDLISSFLFSFVGFGITKEIIDSFTHYGDINDLCADAIGAFLGLFLLFPHF